MVPPWGDVPPAVWRRAWKGMPLPAWRYFASCPSTQDMARVWARQGAAEGCLVYAEAQTRGRGREGRPWFSQPGASLTFSLVVRPRPEERPYLGRFAGWAAVALCTALESLYGLQPQIKWPNDVLLAGRKVAGILVEMEWRTDASPDFAIVGIGINIRPLAFPPHIRSGFPVTSLAEHTSREISRPQLLVALWRHLMLWRREISRPRLLAAWASRLAFRQQWVLVSSRRDQVFPARLLGLTEAGMLRVRTQDGREITLPTVFSLRPLPVVPGAFS